MMRYFLLLIFGLSLCVPSVGQSTRKIKNLQSKREMLQKKIVQQESLLRSTKKDVKSQLSNLALISCQINERKNYIASLDNDMQSLDKDVNSLQGQIALLEKDLDDRKAKYESSVQYMYRHRSIQKKLIFIFSAHSIGKIYRRFRYVNEYATYQRVQGEEIRQKELQVMNKRNEVRLVMNEKGNLLKQHQQAQVKLESQEKDQQSLLNTLKKKQRGIQSVISQRRKEASALNAQIDRLIAIEIAAAKRRAEAEARRREKARKEAEARREAEACQKALLAAKENDKRNTANSSSSNNRSSRGNGTKSSNRKSKQMEVYTSDSEDRQLSGVFERNRGNLPMPITGSYVVVRHYGQYNVAGLSNVVLDNKGIDIKGQSGAKARSIFNGEVSAIFPFAGLVNVIVRHGNYMSVYCNLSSVDVRVGMHINTRQSIGTIHTDSSGNTILHFQLRKETSKLNPEAWLGR